MSPGLTLDELSERTGASLQALSDWCSLGLLGAKPEESFGLEDVERARIIDLCVRRGFDAEVIARAEAREKILSRYLDQVFPNGVGDTYSLAQTAELAGLDADLGARLWEAIAPEDLTGSTHPADVEMLRGWKIALDAGLLEREPRVARRGRSEPPPSTGHRRGSE